MQIISIAGASGSGKTTLAERLNQRLGKERSVLIAVDSYYKDLSHQPPSAREENNFDHPDSLEGDLLMQHLELLLGGEPAPVPIYDFKTHTRIGKQLTAPPEEVIILEGIYALYWPRIREISDHRIFVNTPLKTCLERRLERDLRERGRTTESVLSQWHQNVEPMFIAHAQATKKFASIEIAGDSEIDDTVNLLLSLL